LLPPDLLAPTAGPWSGAGRRVNVPFAIIGTSMAWAESRTVWALRQVTTDPLLRRTMRNNLLPSSLSMARTCTRCTISHLLRGRQDQTSATVDPPRPGAKDPGGRVPEAGEGSQPRH
jgi:hypothetical protein